MRPVPRDDRGSTTPLILGLFLVAMLVTAGAISAGDAFAHQRELQSICDGAAAAAAAGSADLDRSRPVADALAFDDVADTVARYLARDPDRPTVRATAELSVDGLQLSLTCVQVRSVAFGAAFGHGRGVRHVAHSSARAPLRT